VTPLETHLAAGYRFAMHGGPDPAPACAAAIPRAELVAELARVQPMLERDHISRVRSAFIERVLTLPHP